LNFPWSLAQAFLVVPRPIRESVYDYVASNRYKWFGMTDKCQARQPFLPARHRCAG